MSNVLSFLDCCKNIDMEQVIIVVLENRSVAYHFSILKYLDWNSSKINIFVSQILIYFIKKKNIIDFRQNEPLDF